MVTHPLVTNSLVANPLVVHPLAVVLIASMGPSTMAERLVVVVVRPPPLHMRLSPGPVEVILIVDVEVLLLIIVSLMAFSPVTAMASIITFSLPVGPLPWVVGRSVMLALVSGITSRPLGVVSLCMAVLDHWSVFVVSGAASVLTELISHLASCLASSELSVWFEPIVPVHSNHHSIQD